MAGSGFMFNKPDLETSVAEACEHEFFYARCPDGHLNAVSRYSTDGSYHECDYGKCLRAFWFKAGEYAHLRLTDG